MRKVRSEAGTALVETAITLPLLLLVAVGIFEFGRAYQTWLVLTNAAREGARLAVLPYQAADAPEQIVRTYMENGALPYYSVAGVTVDRSATITVNGAPISASQVTVSYPFEFMVLQPVARLVVANTSAGGPLTMTATALMRNESQ